MKYLAALFFLLFSASLAVAQIGFNTGYRHNNAPDWQYVPTSGAEQPLLGNGFSFGLDYWMPLKAVRIDLLPELHYSRFRQAPLPGNTAGNLAQDWISLFLNANIYFLNLDGDCDCPTFSKSGGTLQKGIFLQVSPGISYFLQEAVGTDSAESSQTWAPSLGLALGLDIGLSDLLTLTPIAGLRYFPQAEWQSVGLIYNQEINGGSLKSERSDIRQVYAGLRLGLRFN
jgi:hypothetical protein